MLENEKLEPIDYLVIGHLSVDLTPNGPRLGGTAVYAALTAKALGMRVGIVSSWGMEIPVGPLENIPLVNFPTDVSTTFENVYTPQGRVQFLRNNASGLDYYQVPEKWRSANIIHLAPVAQEVEPGLVRNFPEAFIGVTPQGWMRAWQGDGRVYPTEWPEASFVLERADAAVMSIEDVGGDESRVDEMAASCKVLAVTEAADGVRLFWNGDVRRFRPPAVKEVDPTGSGDIFAAAFFTRLFMTSRSLGSGAFRHRPERFFSDTNWSGFDPHARRNQCLHGGGFLITHGLHLHAC